MHTHNNGTSRDANGTAKSFTSENGHAPIKSSSKCRPTVTVFLSILAAIGCSYSLLIAIWLGTSTLCPDIRSIDQQQKRQVAPAMPLKARDSPSPSRAEKPRSSIDIYSLYHFKQKPPSMEEAVAPAAVKGSNLIICQHSVFQFLVTLIRPMVPSAISTSSTSFVRPLAVGHEQRHAEIHEKLNKHPLQRAVYATADFFHRKRQKKGPPRHKPSVDVSSILVQPSVTTQQKNHIRELGKRVRKLANDDKFDARLAAITWGGVSSYKDSKPSTRLWWSPVGTKNGLEDGQNILFSYLRIMKWPEDLQPKFPMKLCAKGCPAGTYDTRCG